MRSTGLSGRFACDFGTDLHFADIADIESILLMVLSSLL